MKKLLLAFLIFCSAAGVAFGGFGDGPWDSSEIDKTGVADGSLFRWDATTKKLEPVTGATADSSGNVSFGGTVGIGTTAVQPARMTSKLSMTNGETQTAVTAAQILANYWISNQGGSAETDIQLPAVSYPISICVIVEEAFIIEVAPPAGEILDNAGTNLDANDCVDLTGTVGTKAVFSRMQIADGTWRWSIDNVRGTATDTGATD